MKICLIEPFFSGSHKTWAEGYQHHSQHDVSLLTLPGRHWKWRMHGAAITLAQQYLIDDNEYDLLLVSDLLDLNIFLAHTRAKTHGIPVGLYFHENQLTYPWSASDPDVALKRDNHYAFIQYSSALSADQVFFNSAYHKASFLNSLPAFLQQFPDFETLDLIAPLVAKSSVLSLGMDLSYLDNFQKGRPEGSPILLWNHRWEYDKKPEVFFDAISQLVADEIDFRLIVLGESYSKIPAVFKKAETRFSEQLLHFGFAKSKADYAKYLWQADILPVTSIQDFFGGSIVEAIYCGCIPLLPNRLAYPEHIPETLHSKYLYESETDFYPRLKQAILDFDPLEKEPTLQQLVKQYNWRNLAPKYDAVFAALKRNTSF